MAALPTNGALGGAVSAVGGSGFADGGAGPLAGGQAEILPKIHDALNLIYSPHSSNQARREAQDFLESIKTLGQSPSIGSDLAQTRTNSPFVRHYGLSLLEQAIKHKWAEYSDEQVGYLRGWVLQLAEGISRTGDQLYIRNKIAQLWVEVAKRCWGPEWLDMDKLLCSLWFFMPGPTVHKELVLTVLESLSDEIFGTADDPVVAMREHMLSKICVDIFTPAQVLSEQFPSRSVVEGIRSGDDGWVIRATKLLDECLVGDAHNNEDVRGCAIRALSMLHSVMPWAIPQALTSSGCVPTMCNGLASPQVAIQKAALEALHALCARTSFVDDDFLSLIVPMYHPSFVTLGRRLFEWSVVDPEDIDDDKYQFAKKFSEMISCLGNYLDRRTSTLPGDIALQEFFEFLLLVLQSQSLVVSIPVLVTWTRLLHNPTIGPSIGDTALVGHLLELCSSRLIQYESLPEDTQDPTFVLLMEDTDTPPERHAFLGNYRRYSSQVIESIVQLKLVDAFQHILNQADDVLTHLYDGRLVPVDVQNYNKTSMEVLRVDARFTVIESALKGYVKWRLGVDAESPQSQQQKATLEESFESWCNRLLELKFEDPMIRKRILQLLVAFSTTALDRNAGFMLKVLEHILVTWPAPQRKHKLFNEAIKDLQSESMIELQRLASKMPDHLLEVYDQIAGKVNEMIASGTLDEKRQLAYQSFLFIIIHRATKIDQQTRIMRLQPFINPVIAQWNNQELQQALSSYSTFCELLALDKAQRYLAIKEVHKISDWGLVKLDTEGLDLQTELEDRQAVLPLRATKSVLTYSVEKLDKHSPPYEASCALWRDGFPVILPHLLQFLSHAHACHNKSNWTLLPQEMHSVVGRVLADRFWQAGISEGSKDEFYARVVDKRGTLEGLASTIRGSVRFVRDTCYAIIFCMSRLDVHFYGFNELPGPLSHALFADSVGLSAHQVINLLNLVRYLVDHCPVDLRGHFLPPLLAACFQQMDNKIMTEWEKLGIQQGVQAAADELTEEMKAESILRQLTYTAVVMVADFLDPNRTNSEAYAPSSSPANPQAYPTLRKFCLMHSSIVEPLLLFCSHAIRMRDGRCCGVVLRVFRYIIPEFSAAAAAATSSAAAGEGGAPPPSSSPSKGHVPDNFPIPQETAQAVREFVSSDVLQACVASMHEPYFVDLQKELGALIASILLHYCPLTPTPRGVLLCLPGMQAHDVDNAITHISRPGTNPRQQRALVLDLLKDLKGVSVSEMGKLNRTAGLKAEASGRAAKKSSRSKMTQQFMTAPVANSAVGGGGGPGEEGLAPGHEGPTRTTPELDGIAGLFGNPQ